jgi:hypothetical protein
VVWEDGGGNSASYPIKAISKNGRGVGRRGDTEKISASACRRVPASVQRARVLRASYKVVSAFEIQSNETVIN